MLHHNRIPDTSQTRGFGAPNRDRPPDDPQWRWDRIAAIGVTVVLWIAIIIVVWAAIQ